MGFPYHTLVPAAILLDNPGITREEFVQLLHQTEVYTGSIESYYAGREKWDGYFKQLSAEEKRKLIKGQNRIRWDLRGVERYYGEFEDFHAGIYGLSRLLNLEFSPQVIEWAQGKLKKDQFGLEYGVPRLSVIRVRDKEWREPQYKVTAPLASELVDESKSIEGVFTVKATPKKGEVFESASIWDGPDAWETSPIHLYLVERCSRLRRRGGTDYKMKIRGIVHRERTEEFTTLQDLIETYPQYDPDFAIDFSQTSGQLKADLTWGRDNWRWKQVDGKYYLDTGYVFNKIPASFMCPGSPSLGYHDLILTAEAIRNRAWKLLSYSGVNHLRNFLNRFPSSRERHEKAILDSYTSLFAKSRGMTHTELLRFRLLAKVR